MPIPLSSLTAAEVAFCKGVRGGAAVTSTPETIRGELLAELLGGVGALARKYPVHSSIVIDGYDITGRVRLGGLRMPGAVTFRRCRLAGFSATHTGFNALSFAGCILSSGLNLSGASLNGSFSMAHCVVRGQVRLSGASVAGQLLIRDSVVSNPDDHALQLSNVSAVSVLLRSVRILGGARGLSLHTTGDLMIVRCRARGRGESALSFDRAEVNGGVLIRGCRVTNGSVRFSGARFGSAIEIHDSRFAGSPAGSLILNHSEIPGALRVKGSEFSPGLRLTRSRFGSVSMRGDTTVTDPKQALILDSSEVRAGVDLREKVILNGAVSLVGTSVGQQLDLDGARIDVEPGEFAIRGFRTKVGYYVFLSSLRTSGVCGFHGSSAAAFLVDPEADLDIDLTGATYDAIRGPGHDVLTVQDSLRVLGRGSEPSALHQLAASFSGRGDFSGARRIRIHHQDVVRAGDPKWKFLWNRLLRVTVRYGEELWRAIPLWLVVALISTWVIAAIWFESPLPNLLDQDIPGYGFEPYSPSSEVPFNAFFVALGLVVPGNLLDFGQWRPNQDVSMYASLAIRAVGWVLATAVLSGLINWFRRT